MIEKLSASQAHNSPHPMTSPIDEGASAAIGERRRLTLLFTDLAGSTALVRAAEAEHYRELLVAIRRIWHAAAAEHLGRVVLAQGDGALIVFGLPQPGEDDGRRAADAALDIHQRVSHLRPFGVPPSMLPLRMHSGIHTGTLLLSDGDIERGVFDLTGDAMNTAAHLSQQAAAGQILASLQALGPNANFFALSEQAPAGLVIGSEEIRQQVRIVLGRGTATRRFEATALRGLTPFIGRADILESLITFLQQAPAARQRCVVLQGGPGMGKTRLIEQLVAHADLTACTLLRGGCEHYLGAEVLQPFRQMLRAYFQLQAVGQPARSVATAVGAGAPWPPVAADVASRIDAVRSLASPTASALDRPASTSSVVGDLLAFFAAASLGRRLVLVIDDWQWADDASRQLLQALMQIENGPGIILASRPRDDAGDWVAGAQHRTVSPFNQAETGVAVRRLLPQADPFLVARIHDYAGGVPLFIEELCHSVSVEQVFKRIDGHGAAQSWLATLVVSRLERLPADQVAVVRAASVVGNVVPARWLAAACGDAPSQATLQALVDADFLRAEPLGGKLWFKHGITRDAVYDSIGLHQRMALHRRIEAALLAGTDQPEPEDTLGALAYHCRGAGHWDLAAQYAEQAGDKAMAAFALDRARALFLSALDALDRLPVLGRVETEKWCLLANKLGMTCIFDPLSLGNDLTLFERSVALARQLDNVNLLARTLYWLGYMCYGFGRLRAGTAYARQALVHAHESADLRLAAQIKATLGQILTAACQYGEALALMDTAIGAKQQRGRAGSGFAIGSAYTLSCKGSILADQGDFKSAHACFDEATALLGGSTHPVVNSVRNWVAITLMWQGRWAEVARVTSECLHIAENTHLLLLLVVCRATDGFARWCANRDPDGLRQLHDAASWMEARQGQFYTSLYYGWLTEACVAEGDFATARRYAVKALLRAREGERLGETMVCRAMLAMALQRNNPACAGRWLKRAEQSAQHRGSAREAALNQLAAAGLHARLGHAEAAHRVAAQAAQRLGALGMPWHAQQADLLRLMALP